MRQDAYSWGNGDGGVGLLTGMHIAIDNPESEGAPALSVIIPMYNERLRIGATLRDAAPWLSRSGRSAELILIDDGSTDGTAGEVAPWLGESRESDLDRVALVRHEVNRGKGAAVRTGLEAARGRWRLIMDADNSARIHEVEKLFASAETSGAWLVAGSRAVAGSTVQTKLSRRLIGRCFHLAMRVLGLAPVRDTQCGFKLYRDDLARLITQKAREDRFAFDVEHLLIASRHGRVAEVGIEWEHRTGGTIRPVSDGLKMLARAVVIRLRTPRTMERPPTRSETDGAAPVVVRWTGNLPAPAAGVQK